MYSKLELAIAISVFQKDVNINVTSVDFLKKHFIPKIKPYYKFSQYFKGASSEKKN